MSDEQAITLINELVAAEVELVKQENNRPHGATKKAHVREQAAVSRLFYELTERTPSAQQVEEMVSL